MLPPAPPTGQLHGAHYLLLQWSFEEGAIVTIHNHIRFADKKTQAQPFPQYYIGRRWQSQSLNADSETPGPRFFSTALQCLSGITGHDPSRQWCLHSVQKEDGVLTVGGQHFARGIPEVIYFGNDRPAVLKSGSRSWQVGWGKSKGPM